MDSTKYIGRVGALAVALGIGTALTSGTGIAWADETGSSPGKSSTSSNDKSGETSGSKAAKPSKGSAGSSPNVTKPDTSTAPSRKGPLSKLTDRVRKDVESGLDGVGDALKRTQSRLDETRTQLSGTAARPTRNRPSTSTGKRELSKSTRPTQSSPDAAATVPNLDRADPDSTQRPGTVVVKIKEATEDIAQRGRGAMQEISAVPAATVTAPESTTPKISAPPAVSALLSAAGLAPFGAGTSPVAPAQSPALWAMMAWTRREFARTINPLSARVSSANDAASTVAENEIQPMAAVSPNVAVRTDDLTPKPQVPSSLASFTDKLGWVTGPGVTDHWFVAGTDLGIMWNSGYTDPVTGKPIIYTLFGDTYSGPGMTGDWRNNVLFRTIDTDLSNGLQFSDAVINAGAQFPGDPNGVHQWYGTGGPAAGASQIIYDPGVDGLFGKTYTMIPTSAIAIENPNAEGGYTQYATVMSIRTWDNPGSWTTNYSGIAYSNDGGKTWTVDPATVRSSGWFRAGPAYVPGDEHFQQNALVVPDDPTDPYVYVYGTPSGRQGSAYLARVEKDQVTNLDAYQYWSGENSNGAGKWVTGDPSAAVPVFGSSSTDFLPQLYKVIDTFTFGLFTKIANGIWVGGLPTNGNVSEMSVQYNEYLGKYVVLYTDGGNNVVMRVSDSPQGEWSNTTTLVNNNLTTNTGMYAPMVHPMSGTDYFNSTNADGTIVDNSHYLYYNLSYWGDYNVQLMRTDLKSMKTVSV
ncbi:MULTISPECIES: DUF4185 domain-containing protein [unclassified Mycolicibacterium]|uniref:DUF4185 domain-containing protein n=1 Tax=unclassified Mycolicibacterium TaxID=2636767 RepID=UPI0012DCE201|nr:MULTISPECIES: DUF4185 domain-containing protein [unclassified Mycolicibacterium]MUL83760.1 DUF4185 domain-containing protein [Mycolicibacterium sp. CBMA 329]MUL90751.1 DUF4185 domain-containing protein [Mycolicibacterium sp. CBMA 331]MUM00719.1 DUF4185 domain-containing protein [Mycolicibacterium sp. CBMA 334]MUM27518.1 DUF4185 domain-containing protein [Mycolicibacterium sp. CBMA 295]MUM41695.1 DUF4185 domain-containing protein [Mycolicibacterium sp. CBMA 247]